MAPRKCSREDCPSQHVVKDRTVICRHCKATINLPCYGINKAASEIFINQNVIMLCDECLVLDPAEKSPKRNKSELMQRTIDMINPTTAMGAPLISSPSNKANSKPTTQHLIETLARKLEVNTMTISALKVSVDSINVTGKHVKEGLSISV